MRLGPKAVAVAFMVVACWQIGDGLWIYAKAGLAQLLIAEAWQRSIASGSETKPWPWADTWPVARLQLVEKDIDLYVLEGANGSALAFGPGHVRGSAPPGAPGISVIGGHRDTHFRFLQQLAAGDLIKITPIRGKQRFYRVVNQHIANVEHAPLRIRHDKSGLLLITCYPFDSLRPGGPLRYVVSAMEEASAGERA